MTIEPLPTPSTLTIETRGGVAIVRLSHGKVNAFDVELLREWMAALEALENGEPSAVVHRVRDNLLCRGRPASPHKRRSRLHPGVLATPH